MRSHYTRQLIENPYKVSPYQQRSRLKSLKQLRNIPIEDPALQTKKQHQNIMKLLQKKLIQQAIKQQSQSLNMLNTHYASPLKRKSKSIRPSQKPQSKQCKKQQQQKKLLQLKQSNKLFVFFQQQYRQEIPQDKVQRQKVNFWERQFNQMKAKVNHKMLLNKNKIQELERNVSKKYVDLHEYHNQSKQLAKQIKEQQKIQLLNQKKKKSKGQTQMLFSGNNNNSTVSNQQTILSNSSNLSTFKLKPPSLQQKHYIIQQTINQLKKQTSLLQQQIQTHKTKLKQIQQQWIGFLKLFINCGYYLINGLDSVIQEMKKYNIKFKESDILSEIFDQNAKRYFLGYFESYAGKRNSEYEANDNERFQNARKEFDGRKKIKSDFQMKTLADKNNLKDIYSNTRQIMNNLVKKPSFKQSPQLNSNNKKQPFLPKIQSRVTNQSVNKNRTSQNKNRKEMEMIKKSKTIAIAIGDEKQRQINRINHIYFSTEDEQLQKRGKLIKRLLFGFNVK